MYYASIISLGGSMLCVYRPTLSLETRTYDVGTRSRQREGTYNFPIANLLDAADVWLPKSTYATYPTFSVIGIRSIPVHSVRSPLTCLPLVSERVVCVKDILFVSCNVLASYLGPSTLFCRVKSGWKLVSDHGGFHATTRIYPMRKSQC